MQPSQSFEPHTAHRLEAFKALMSREGLPVQLSRMLYDRLYAYECIAQAHATGNEPLRRMALQLFQVYQAGDRPALDMH